MKPEPKWISKKALLLLHEESLAEFGGGRGMRDEGLLDSALARPANLNYYEPSATLAQLAASYGFGVAKSRAFGDSKKRAALLCIGLFLAINGYRLAASQSDAVNVILGVASGKINEAALAAWLGANIRPRT